jgi:hypothetical protein
MWIVAFILGAILAGIAWSLLAKGPLFLAGRWER